MSKQRQSLALLLGLQLLAIFIYPPSLFQAAPQAWVMPVIVLFIPFLLALLAMNLGAMAPLAGRTSLIFVQGVNIVMRLIVFFPNLRTATGQWNFLLLLAQLLGIALSWYTITQMEKVPVATLLWRQPDKSV